MNVVRASIVVLCLTLTACRPGSASAQTVTFPDPNLEAAIRSALSLPSGSITRSNLAKLVSLNACCASISNLSGLEWATNLVELDLSGNLLGDLASLANLTALTNLNAGANRITNCTALAGLTRLDALWLYGNPIQNFNPLTNLTGLTSLILYNAGIADVRPLARLTGLKYLELRWNPLTNAPSVLPGLTNLTSLYLGGTSLSNVTFLQSLTRLTFLNLDHNQVNDFSPLFALTALNQLDIGYNPVTNVAPTGPISGFPNLTGLYLSGIALSNVTALTNVSSLSSLTLCNNRVADLSPLAALTNLRDLGLSWNPATNPATVAALTNLTTLWLEGNALSDLGFVQGMKSLKGLGLRQNRMGDLGSMGGLTNLVAIIADQNRLTDIASLQNLPRLAKVQLTGNLLDLSSGSPSMITIGTLSNLGANVSFLPQNQPPTVSLPSSWNIATNTTSALSIEIADDATPVDQLLVSASSANPALIPNSGITIAGPGAIRILTVTPALNQSGTGAITVTVTDSAGLSTNINLSVNVVVPQPVVFGDADLENEVRLALNQPSGVLTGLDLEKLTQLTVFDRVVYTLSGLEAATNLSTLILDGTATTNFAALANLKQLTFLALDRTGISDLSVLTNFTGLLGLSLEGNSISNLNFLADLTSLTSLDLNENALTDISQIASLGNLDFLALNNNLITTLQPLQQLPRLAFADLRWNLLNTASNSAAMTVIQSLAASGVWVTYLPQRGPPTFLSMQNWIIVTNATSTLYVDIMPNGFADTVTLGLKSSNTNLVPNGKFQITRFTNDWWAMSVTPIAGKTGVTTMTITATNDLGFSNKYNIQVTVKLPLPFDNRIVNSDLIFRTGANGPWAGETNVTHDGAQAAQSDLTSNGSQSWLETTLQGPGLLSFWWKVSSETNADWLECYLDDVLSPPRISGEVDWQQRTLGIPVGTHIVRWRYVKDFVCCASGEDAGWLDQITFFPQSWLEFPAPPSNGIGTLLLHPVPGRYYEVQASTNLSGWFRLAFLAPTNANLTFQDFAANTERRFYRLHEFLADAIRLDPPGFVGNQIQLVLHSPTDLRFELQVSSNLTDWTVLGVATNSVGTITFLDLPPANSSARFYRARMLP